jgi:hypothetical protein
MAIKKITNGLLSKLSHTMVLPFGQKTGPGGYYTLIYMLKHIIRLLAVVKIITNETTRTLNLMAKQSTKVHNVIYQNHLALDYLLASEEGVCRKFNLSNYCLQIYDKEKVIEKITDKMRKLAHVPIWMWKGRNHKDLFGGRFSALGGFKTLIGAIG